MGNCFSAPVDLATRPTVVIVGGGYAGSNIAGRLDSKVNVVLIERKNHYFHNIGALRPVVLPDTVNTTLVPYDQLLTNGAFIQAQVDTITPTEVRLVGTDTVVKFDYLIIATGSSYPFPMKSQFTTANDVPAIFKEASSAVKDANNIVIVGGGPVGIELLGEIGHVYPDKNVTVIQSNDKILVGPVKDELRESVLTRIKDNFPKCKVITGERVNITDEMKEELKEAGKVNKAYLVGNRTIETSKGNNIDADIVFFATGTRLNNSTFKESFQINTENGRLTCQPTLQLQGYDNIFAIGDCADMGPMMAAVAGDYGQAPILENNILAMCDGKPQNLKQFPLPGAMMSVPLGPEQGASQLPFAGGKVVGATITKKMKAEGLFTSEAWKQLGYENIESTIKNQTCKEINGGLSDDIIARLAKGTKIDETRFKELINGDAANPVIEEENSDNNNDNNDKNDNDGAQEVQVNTQNGNNGQVVEEDA